MGPYEQAIHLLNFLAPAWGVALFVVLLSRLMGRAFMPTARTSGWTQSAWTQLWVNGVLGSAVLVAGLWVWGVDGKAATYGVLVLVAGSSQWVLCRAWRH